MKAIIVGACLAVVSFSLGRTVAQSGAVPTESTQTDWQTVHPGVQAEGEKLAAILPTDQAIHPAGRTIRFDGRPTAISLRPDGHSAAIVKTSGSFTTSKGPLLILDLQSGRIIQEFVPYEQADASFTGLAYSADGTRLFASDPFGALIVASVAADGTLHDGKKIELAVKNPERAKGFIYPHGANTDYPGGLGVDPNGHFLYVALSIDNTVAVVDLEKLTVVDRIPVGNAPYTVLIDGDFVYVTNQGGRQATAADFITISADTPLVADTFTGRPTSGTVSVIDLRSRKVVSTIAVGLQPTAMLLHQNTLFVANTNSDTVSVIDTKTRTVIKTISIQPFPNAPFGSSPNALTLLPDKRLIVSLGANNALAVYDWKGPADNVTLLGLIPTAWYPSGVVFDSKHRTLVTIALKGAGPAGMEHMKDTGGYGQSVLHFVGCVSLTEEPARKALAVQTNTVITDNRWVMRSDAALAARPSAPAKSIPDRIGEPSLIKHVFYVIKENHKYDEDLGDDSRGNGQPSNVEFGRGITPNQHAIVQQFPLLDNFYVSGTVSIDGHQWTDSAFVNDYIERDFGGRFKRGYPFNGGDSLAYAPSGFLWENAVRHGVSVQAFGEYAAHFDGPHNKTVPWTDWYHDAKILEGKLSGELRVPIGDFRARSDVPSLDKLLDRNFPGFDAGIPDQYRVDIFLREFTRHLENHDLPSLTILTLPNDHTAGTSPGYPTPRAQVADGDSAFGRLVEAISHSPYWKDSAIFSVEDDAAYGVDHVDGHRSPIYVVSPYARRNLVDHTYYTQIDVVRTIEQILGLPPMNQKDLVAAPMRTVFTDIANLASYTAVPNEIALDEMNPTQSASRVERAWIRESLKLFTAQPLNPDVGDENRTKRVLWYASFNFKRPFPGDSHVLLPSEVQRGPRRKDED